MSESIWCKMCDGSGEIPSGRHVEKCVTCDGTGKPVVATGSHVSPATGFEGDEGVVWCYDGESAAQAIAEVVAGTCDVEPGSDEVCGCKYPAPGEMVTLADATRMIDETRAGVVTEVEYVIRDHFKGDYDVALMARIGKLRFRATASLGRGGRSDD